MKEPAVISLDRVIFSRASGQDFENPGCIMSLRRFHNTIIGSFYYEHGFKLPRQKGLLFMAFKRGVVM